MDFQGDFEISKIELNKELKVQDGFLQKIFIKRLHNDSAIKDILVILTANCKSDTDELTKIDKKIFFKGNNSKISLFITNIFFSYYKNINYPF